MSRPPVEMILDIVVLLFVHVNLQTFNVAREAHDPPAVHEQDEDGDADRALACHQCQSVLQRDWNRCPYCID